MSFALLVDEFVRIVVGCSKHRGGISFGWDKLLAVHVHRIRRRQRLNEGRGLPEEFCPQG